ncbi:MAG: hypothetical protein KF805_10660 [Phycisphaeraceae bacterium]|nr:hypothetical protein [Phycisphaeraceae bacterium]
MSRTLRTLPAVLVAVAGFSASWAQADDLNPPPWRGQLHSTFQHWTFPVANPSGAPDVWNNPSGTPQMTPSDNSQYFPEFNGRTGVWCLPLEGDLRFRVPNDNDPDALYKIIWIQVTWLGAILPDAGGESSTGKPFQLTADPQTVQLPDGWNHTTWEFIIPECPDFEIAFLRNLATAPLYIDQVVIDTICIVPSPSTSVLALAGLVVAGRRRR